jgi:hypothetical protein
MDPIIVHYVPDPQLGSDGVDGLVRESGGVPLRTWAANEHVYAVIAEPSVATIDALVATVEVLAAARFDLAGDPSELGAQLPDSLPKQIEFPPEARGEPQAAIIGPGTPLVRCHCERGIHPAPLCVAATGTSSDELVVS